MFSTFIKESAVVAISKVLIALINFIKVYLNFNKVKDVH